MSQAQQENGVQIPMQNVLKAMEKQRNAAYNDLALAQGTIEYLEGKIAELEKAKA